MTSISVKLPDGLLREVALEAETRRVGKSVVIRDCIVRALRGGKKSRSRLTCLDLMGDKVGSFRGPHDLSTNRRHLIDAIANANRTRKGPR